AWPCSAFCRSPAIAAKFLKTLRTQTGPGAIYSWKRRRSSAHDRTQGRGGDMYDYIIIGGGSAGCVLANRLSADPTIKVCLLEAGGPDKSLLIHIPAGTAAILPTRYNNWAFQTEPQSGLGGRRGYVPRGKALGGSSSINAMIYMRGHRSDYDHWAALGNEGWSYADVLPYFKRSEHNERGADEYHAVGGPLNVADLRSPDAAIHAFVEAGAQAGFSLTPDFNGAQQEGVGLYQVTQKNGE